MKEAQSNYKKPKIISRRKFLLNTGIFVGGVAAIFAGSSAVFYNAALQNKKNNKEIEKPVNNLVLLGDKSEFNNMTVLTKINYSTEVQDAWIIQNKSNHAFKCPCHGGEFDEWGRDISGPLPRPLDIYKPVIQEDKLYFDYNTKRVII